MEEHPATGVIGGPLERELLHGVVAAVAVDDQDAAKSAVRHAVQDVAHDAQVRLDPQRDRAGELAEVRRDAVRHHRKHRHAERLGGVGRHAFGEDAVDREPQMAVLLGAAERQHRAVVVPQVLFHLHPVHVGNAHVDPQSVVRTGVALAVCSETPLILYSRHAGAPAHRCGGLLRLAGVGNGTADAARTAARDGHLPPSTDRWIGIDEEREAIADIDCAPGYDNQPMFSPDGSRILFAANRDGKQIDIFVYERAGNRISQLTETAENENSPTYLPAGIGGPGGFSVVRTEPDRSQRLWRFDAQGRNPQLVLTDIKPIGYRASGRRGERRALRAGPARYVTDRQRQDRHGRDRGGRNRPFVASHSRHAPGQLRAT